MALHMPRRSSMLVFVALGATLVASIMMVLDLGYSGVVSKSDLMRVLNPGPSEGGGTLDILKKNLEYQINSQRDYYIAIGIAVASGVGLFSIMFT